MSGAQAGPSPGPGGSGCQGPGVCTSGAQLGPSLGGPAPVFAFFFTVSLARSGPVRVEKGGVLLVPAHLCCRHWPLGSVAGALPGGGVYLELLVWQCRAWHGGRSAALGFLLAEWGLGRGAEGRGPRA